MSLIPLPPHDATTGGASRWQFTSESVAEGHPDKVADRISDEIVDACLAENARARVAIETLVTAGRCIIAGEVRGAVPAYEQLARRAIRDIGYADAEFGWETVPVECIGVARRAGRRLGEVDRRVAASRSPRECLTHPLRRVHGSHRIARTRPHRAQARHSRSW